MALATFIIFLAVMHRILIGIPILYRSCFRSSVVGAGLCIYMFVWVRVRRRLWCAHRIHVGSTSWSKPNSNRVEDVVVLSAFSAAHSSPP